MTVEDIYKLMADQAYYADKSVAISVFLSIQLQKPLLIEGPAGVGKTEIAKVLSKALDTDLIRLQCYEGLDAHHAIYEWHYQRQLLHLKLMEGEKNTGQMEEEIFSEKFLMERPFESYLLELLSDWQITIPELGTIKANSKPYVVLTGNRTRELSEALRRRCLYLWIDYPSFEKELTILRSKVPSADKKLGEQICEFMKHLRQLKLEKTPGVAETLDWAEALAAMHYDHLDKDVIADTLGVVLKDWQDIRTTTDSLSELLEKTGVSSKIG